MRGGVRQPTCVVRMTTRRMYSQIRALKDVPTIRTAGATRGASRRNKSDMTEQEQIKELQDEISILRTELQELPPVEANATVEDDDFYLLRFQKNDEIKEKETQIAVLERKIERSKRRAVEVQFRPSTFFGGEIPGSLRKTKVDGLRKFMELLDLDTKKPDPTPEKPNKKKNKLVGEMINEIEAYVGTMKTPGHLRETFVDMNIYNETKWNEPGFQKMDTSETSGLEPFQQLCVFQTEILQKTTSESHKQEYKELKGEVAPFNETKRILDDFYFHPDNNTLDENDPMPFTLEETKQTKNKEKDLEDWYDTNVPTNQRYDSGIQESLDNDIQRLEAILSNLSPDEDSRRREIEAKMEVKVAELEQVENKSTNIGAPFLRNKIKEWLVSNAAKYYGAGELEADESVAEETDIDMSTEEINKRYEDKAGGINFERHLVEAFKTNEARIDQAERDIEAYNEEYPNSRILTVTEIYGAEDNDALSPTSENYQPDLLLALIKEKTDEAMVNALLEDIKTHNAKYGSHIDVSMEDIIWDAAETERDSQLKVLHGRIDRYNKDAKTPIVERNIVDVNDVVSLDLPDDLDLFQQYNLLTKRMTDQDTHQLTDESRDISIRNRNKTDFEDLLNSISNKYLTSQPGGETGKLKGREQEIYEYQRNMNDIQMEKTFEEQFLNRLLTTDPKNSDYRFMKELNRLYKKYNNSDEDVYMSADWENVEAALVSYIRNLDSDIRHEIYNRIYFEESDSKAPKEDIRDLAKKQKKRLAKIVLQKVGLKYK